MVLDRDSQQLVLRSANNGTSNGDLGVDLQQDCPYCHRPIRRDSGHESSIASSPGQADFINPDYFQLLHDTLPEAESSPPASPVPLRRRRLTQPALIDGESTTSERQQRPRHHRISSAAFSQGYFKRFFVEEAELGRGGKGVVLLVRHVLDGVSLGHFACKRVPVGDNHEWLEKVLTEVQLLQHLSHQNVVSYRHVWLENAQVSTFGPSVPCAFILQQYCNAGDLQRYVYGAVSASLPATAEQLKERMRRRSRGTPDPAVNRPTPRKLQFEEIYSFFRDITAGLRFLHANGYVHRDLKPSNCLLHETGNELRVLVSDFGEVQLENSVRRSTGTTGTISYCAPEVLRREYPGGPYGNFTFKSDVFSLGVILHFLCFAQLPYRSADVVEEEKEDLEKLRQEISEWQGFDGSLKHLRPDLPEKLYTMLERLLSVDPARRPTSDEVLMSIQAGGKSADARRYARAKSTSPDLRRAPRIQPVEQREARPSRSPYRRERSRSRYDPRAAAPPTNGPIFPPPRPSSSSSSSSRHEELSQSPHSANHDKEENHNLILRPRFRRTPSSQASEGSDPSPNYARPIIHQHHHPHSPSSPQKDTHNPPLLPPPRSSDPSSSSSTSSTSSLLFVTTGRYNIPLPTIGFAVFIFKVVLVQHACVPLAVNHWVYYPLVVLAVVMLPVRNPWVQLASLVLHSAVMGVGLKMGRMCIWNVPGMGLL